MHRAGQGKGRWAAPFPRTGGALARHGQHNRSAPRPPGPDDRDGGLPALPGAATECDRTPGRVPPLRNLP
jgi:hypothetical protein